jgi:hypothetical protein
VDIHCVSSYTVYEGPQWIYVLVKYLLRCGAGVAGVRDVRKVQKSISTTLPYILYERVNTKANSIDHHNAGVAGVLGRNNRVSTLQITIWCMQIQHVHESPRVWRVY